MPKRDSRVSLIIGALLILVPVVGRATPDRPPDFKFSEYTTVHAKAEIPPAVLEAFSSLCGGCPLADIGAPFNATDFVEPGLPERRLIAAGVSGSHWFLEYEHGGRGLHEHFVLFDLRNNHATCEWAGGAPPAGCQPRAAIRGPCGW
jgi:hypothetical protein